MSGYAQQLIGWLQAAIVFLLACNAFLGAGVYVPVRENRALRAGAAPSFIPALLRKHAP
jgi:hypothetical protein